MVVAVQRPEPDRGTTKVVEEPDAVAEGHRHDGQVDLVDQFALQESSQFRKVTLVRAARRQGGA
ncbi:hypothetical protein JHN63_33800 [Streptomyces sp. MBT65]|uniref:hypothetical protein n=1 Tax=Streptomyces sp. MBT65 TaxID=1488395 RepID=UPI00190D02A8|nr:hypothetical protein [Streptomyces sp. MBT65]MBK3578688.1 hypothetical protein [Streptomyces sp. MBT65]